MNDNKKEKGNSLPAGSGQDPNAANAASSEVSYSFDDDLTEEQRTQLRTNIGECQHYQGLMKAAFTHANREAKCIFGRANEQAAPHAWDTGLKAQAIREILEPLGHTVKGFEEIFPKSTAGIYRCIDVVEAFENREAFLAKVKEKGTLKAVYALAAEIKREKSGNPKKASGSKKKKNPDPGTREHLTEGLNSVGQDIEAFQAKLTERSLGDVKEIFNQLKAHRDLIAETVEVLAKELGVSERAGSDSKHPILEDAQTGQLPPPKPKEEAAGASA